MAETDNRKRLMGLDFGSKTVGVAVSDPLFLAAQPVEIIRREHPTKLRRTYARIEELILQYDAMDPVKSRSIREKIVEKGIPGDPIFNWMRTSR